MLHELRTYTLKPGTVAEFERRYAQRHPARTRFSPVFGFWRTEIGTLNQIVHIWPYEDLNHRASIRDAARADPELQRLPWCWDLIVTQENDILLPAPFMRPLAASGYGPGNIYELRVDTYQPGKVREAIDRWAALLPSREKYSPLAGCWSTELGHLNRLVHLWVYENLAERARIQAAAAGELGWPPETGDILVREENKILVPLAFSPLQ